MAAASREAAARRRSSADAKRGLLSERAWADVRRAARVAHDEGVTLRLHGVVVTNNTLKQLEQVNTKHMQQKPVESAGGTQQRTTEGKVPPSPSKRKKRSAQRLEEFLEKKRNAFIAELIARGCDSQHAQEACAHAEQERLARIAQSRANASATSMEAESASEPAESAEPRRAQ